MKKHPTEAHLAVALYEAGLSDIAAAAIAMAAWETQHEHDDIGKSGLTLALEAIRDEQLVNTERLTLEARASQRAVDAIREILAQEDLLVGDLAKVAS